MNDKINICDGCLKPMVCFILIERCEHSFHYACLLNHVKESIKSDDSTIKCLKCKNQISLEFLQEAFNSKDLEKFVKKCASCLNGFFEIDLKKENCNHKMCQNCLNLIKNCSKCTKKLLTKKVLKNLKTKSVVYAKKWKKL